MSEIKLKPVGNRVLVKQVKVEEKTSSGIIIPDSAKEKPLQAEVLSVGEDVEQIKVGQNVIYDKFAGTEINFDSEDYLILEQSDILAIV